MMASACNKDVGLVHLELGCTSTEGSNVEGNGSRLGISDYNNIGGVGNSEGRESPLGREFIIKEWDSLLEVEGLRSLGRCRPAQQDGLVEVELRNVGVSVSNIHKPTTTRKNCAGLEFRTNSEWVDDTARRKERSSSFS